MKPWFLVQVSSHQKMKGNPSTSDGYIPSCTDVFTQLRGLNVSWPSYFVWAFQSSHEARFWSSWENSGVSGDLRFPSSLTRVASLSLMFTTVELSAAVQNANGMFKGEMTCNILTIVHHSHPQWGSLSIQSADVSKSGSLLGAVVVCQYRQEQGMRKQHGNLHLACPLAPVRCGIYLQIHESSSWEALSNSW